LLLGSESNSLNSELRGKGEPDCIVQDLRCFCEFIESSVVVSNSDPGVRLIAIDFCEQVCKLREL